MNVGFRGFYASEAAWLVWCKGCRRSLKLGAFPAPNRYVAGHGTLARACGGVMSVYRRGVGLVVPGLQNCTTTPERLQTVATIVSRACSTSIPSQGQGRGRGRQ